jgi:hypothetical protein
LSKKVQVGGRPNASVAFAAIAEIIFVSYLIMLASFLSESEMME